MPSVLDTQTGVQTQTVPDRNQNVDLSINVTADLSEVATAPRSTNTNISNVASAPQSAHSNSISNVGFSGSSVSSENIPETSNDNGNVAYMGKTEPSRQYDHWFIDSGATQHMCCRKEWIQNYKDSTPSHIQVADGNTIIAKGEGTVDLLFKVGQQILEGTLHQVLYVPDLHGNLFSVNQTVSLGNKVIFNTSGCVIKDNKGATIAVASKSQNLYQLDAVRTPNQAHLANQAGNVNLWHRRLGHLSIDGIKELAKGMVEGIDPGAKFELGFCEACVHGKQHRAPFPNSTSRATKILEIIHTDVCGPMSVPSIGKA